MPAKPLTPQESACLRIIGMWFDSMRDWFAILFQDDGGAIELSPDAPRWLHVAASRLDKSIFAPVHSVLADAKMTPYRIGYAMGIMKWGRGQMTIRPPSAVPKAVKEIRLSRRARKEMYRLFQNFAISIQIIGKKNGRYVLLGKQEETWAKGIARRYSGRDESDFHRGVSDGLRGLGRDAPGDRSTDATDIYLLLVIWWRFVVKLQSVSQLHSFVLKSLGPARAGDKKRTEKICERIGLKLRKPGRPKKIPTLATMG